VEKVDGDATVKKVTEHKKPKDDKPPPKRSMSGRR
jgi:hypothetical protein